MMDLEENTDQIAAFVDGQLTPEARAAFEVELATNPDLQDAVADLRQIRLGLKILDATTAGHIDSRTLAQYATEPSAVDDATAHGIVDHLRLCAPCREELLICRQTASPAATGAPEAKQNLLFAFIEWLLAPRFVLRPAYAVIVLALLLVPLAYVGLRPERTESTIPVSLIPVGARSEGASVGEITITPSVGVIRLQSGLPDIENERCVFSLYFAAGQQLEFARRDSLTGNSFALDIPATYFRRDGRYTLQVRRLADEGDKEVPYEFRLQITHSR
jgi:hypothetical protein